MTSSQVPSGAAVAAETALPSRRRRPLSLRSIARASVPYWLLLPVVVVIGAILGYPLYHLVKLSFEQYGLFELIRREGKWIGLDNFSFVLHSDVFWDTLAADGRVHRRHRWLDHRPGDADRAAARADQPDRPRALTAGLVLVWAMPVVVAVQVWFWMTNFQNGVLNHVLGTLGLGDYSGHDWFATTFSKLAMVGILILWAGIPFITITVYAALAQVPGELVDAAEIDGAGFLRVFRDVTFPVIKPVLLILTSLSIIWNFGVFAQPYLLIGASHVDATNYLMGVYVYLEGYGQSNFGRGAAISILMLGIVIVMTAFHVRAMVKMGDVK